MDASDTLSSRQSKTTHKHRSSKRKKSKSHHDRSRSRSRSRSRDHDRNRRHNRDSKRSRKRSRDRSPPSSHHHSGSSRSNKSSSNHRNNDRPLSSPTSADTVPTIVEPAKPITPPVARSSDSNNHPVIAPANPVVAEDEGDQFINELIAKSKFKSNIGTDGPALPEEVSPQQSTTWQTVRQELDSALALTQQHPTTIIVTSTNSSTVDTVPVTLVSPGIVDEDCVNLANIRSPIIAEPTLETAAVPEVTVPSQTEDIPSRQRKNRKQRKHRHDSVSSDSSTDADENEQHPGNRADNAAENATDEEDTPNERNPNSSASSSSSNVSSSGSSSGSDDETTPPKLSTTPTIRQQPSSANPKPELAVPAKTTKPPMIISARADQPILMPPMLMPLVETHATSMNVSPNEDLTDNGDTVVELVIDTVPEYSDKNPTTDLLELAMQNMSPMDAHPEKMISAEEAAISAAAESLALEAILKEMNHQKTNNNDIEQQNRVDLIVREQSQVQDQLNKKTTPSVRRSKASKNADASHDNTGTTSRRPPANKRKRTSIVPAVTLESFVHIMSAHLHDVFANSQKHIEWYVHNYEEEKIHNATVNKMSIDNAQRYGNIITNKDADHYSYYVNHTINSLADYYSTQGVQLGFPLDALKLFLAYYKHFVNTSDFVNTNAVSGYATATGTTRQTKASAGQLVNGAILGEFLKGPTVFTASLVRTCQTDLDAIKLLLLLNITIPANSLLSLQWNSWFKTPVYTREVVPVVRSNTHVTIPFNINILSSSVHSNTGSSSSAHVNSGSSAGPGLHEQLKRNERTQVTLTYVLLSINFQLMYDATADGFVPLLGSFERKLPYSLRAALSNTAMIVLETIFVTNPPRIGILDLVMYVENDKSLLGDTYDDRQFQLQKLFGHIVSGGVSSTDDPSVTTLTSSAAIMAANAADLAASRYPKLPGVFIIPPLPKNHTMGQLMNYHGYLQKPYTSSSTEFSFIHQRTNPTVAIVGIQEQHAIMAYRKITHTDELHVEKTISFTGPAAAQLIAMRVCAVPLHTLTSKQILLGKDTYTLTGPVLDTMTNAYIFPKAIVVELTDESVLTVSKNPVWAIELPANEDLCPEQEQRLISLAKNNPLLLQKVMLSLEPSELKKLGVSLSSL